MKKEVNLSAYPEFNKSFENYQELINYYRNFSKDFYNKRNFYCEGHHTVPRCEDPRSSDIVYLDLAHHALAHLLRAQELELQGDYLFALKNYCAANRVLGVFVNRYESSIPEIVLEKASLIKQKCNEATSIQFKNTVYVTDGLKTRRILEEDLEKFLKVHPAFYKGRTFNTSKNHVWISKGSERKHLERQEALLFLEKHKDWKLGMGDTAIHQFKKGYLEGTTTGMRWVHQGSKRIAVKPEEISSFLEKGWSIGSGNHLTNLHKKVIHKGLEMKNVLEKDLNTYLEDGWILGRTEEYKKNCRHPKKKKNEA